MAFCRFLSVSRAISLSTISGAGPECSREEKSEELDGPEAR